MAEADENALLQADVEETNPLPRSRKVALFGLLVLLLFIAGVVLGYCLGRKNGTSKEEQLTDELAQCSRQHGGIKYALSSPGLLSDLHDSYLREIKPTPLFWLRDHYQNQVFSGSSMDRFVVSDIVKHLRRLGIFDEIQVNNYTALICLPDATGSLLQVLSRTSNQLIYRETISAGIQNISRGSVHHSHHQAYHHHGKKYNITEAFVQPFVAYSEPGAVQGELVNINFGLESDFKALMDAHVLLTDKIGLMKKDDNQAMLEPLVDKIYRAEAYNLSAVLMYTDSSTCDNVTHYETLNELGDPQTPGYASLDGVWRKPVKEIRFPKIPVQTISCNTAHMLLQRMSGQVAPAHWQSNYNGTLYMGRKSKKADSWFVQLDTSNHCVHQRIQNIMATVRGFISPGQVVMLGASRNSFFTSHQGAAVSTESMLRMAEPLAYLIKESKWLPKRSITFSFWGGSEFGNIGRTEFMERSMPSLDDIVAYIDLDNQDLAASLSLITSKSLQEFVTSTVNLRVGSLSDSDVQETYQNEPNDDEDSWSYSGSDVSDSLADLLDAVQYVDPDDLPLLQWCHLPVIQTSVGSKIPRGLSSPLKAEITRLQALLMLSLADQVVLQYNNVAMAKAIRSGVHRLLFSAHHLDDKMKIALETASTNLSARTAVFDHMIDNRLDYSNEDFLVSVNVVLLQLNKLLSDIRMRISRLLASLPDLRQSDDLVLADDLTHNHSSASLQEFSELLVELENANDLIKTVHFHVMSSDARNMTESLDVPDGNFTGLERGWV